MADCAYPPCPAPATGRSKYCSPIHREATAREKYEERTGRRPVKPKAPDDVPLETRVAREQERIQQLEIRRTLSQLTRTEAKRQAYQKVLQDCLPTFEPSEVFPFPVKDTHTDVDWAICISDMHVGQLTPIESTGGMYEQTVAITRMQVDRLINAVSQIFHEASGKRVRRLWIPVLGDIVEGDSMRPSQLRAIEMPVVKQTIEAYDLLIYMVRSLLQLPGLEELIVDVVGGNHDRTTAKPGNAGLGETDYVDTFAWLIGAMMERQFEADPRVTVKNWDTFFGTRKFAGRRHVFEHGASIRTGGGSYGGVPFYPLVNAARNYESMVGGVDMVWFGHMHTPYVLPIGQEGWVVGNGAFPATTNFVQSRYKKIIRPVQWLVEFHERVGATKFEPLYLDVDLQKPGDVWGND